MTSQVIDLRTIASHPTVVIRVVKAFPNKPLCSIEVAFIELSSFPTHEFQCEAFLAGDAVTTRRKSWAFKAAASLPHRPNAARRLKAKQYCS